MPSAEWTGWRHGQLENGRRETVCQRMQCVEEVKGRGARDGDAAAQKNAKRAKERRETLAGGGAKPSEVRCGEEERRGGRPV